MTPIEIGLSASFIIVIVLIVRLSLSPTMQESTKQPTRAELKREIANLRATIETQAEQNTYLRNRLQEAENDRHAQEVTLASLRAEMGRTTK